MKHPPAALLTALAILLVPTASALATDGSYEVSACNYAPEAVNNSWTWSTSDSSQPSHYAEHANCPDRLGGSGGRTDQEGGLSSTDALGLSSGAPPGTSAGWTFAAPAGTTISGIAYERYIGHESDPDNDWFPALRADGVIVPGETCLDTVGNGESCLVGGPPGHGGEPSVITGLSAHQLALNITCDAPTGDECVTGATLYQVWAAMYGATVTISDPTPPTHSTPTGTLWEPSATGFHTGAQNVTVAADDIGGGVRSIELAADDHLLQTYTASCNFTYPQPCPNTTGTQNFTLPTTQLTDGVHTITLTATDAAGNKTTTSQQVAIANNPPQPPTELKAVATPPDSTRFTATWTNPSGEVAPITGATYQVCPADGSDACSTSTAAPAGGPATVTVPGPGVWALAVWLTNAAGKSSHSNAAHSNLTVLPSSGHPGSSASSSPGNREQGSAGSSGLSGGSQIPKARLHLSETLRGRDLIVNISGPTTGRVRLAFTARLHNHQVASGARTRLLKQGRLTAQFKLGPRTASHTKIVVSAKLDHDPTVTSTLRR